MEPLRRHILRTAGAAAMALSPLLSAGRARGQVVRSDPAAP
jgi:hypothetical protein